MTGSLSTAACDFAARAQGGATAPKPSNAGPGGAPSAVLSVLQHHKENCNAATKMKEGALSIVFGHALESWDRGSVRPHVGLVPTTEVRTIIPVARAGLLPECAGVVENGCS